MAFAIKADQDGFPQVARLFRAAGEAETVHALNHLRILKEVGSTEQNLAVAINGENYEFKKIYPTFIDEPLKDKRKDAAWSFDMVKRAQRILDTIMEGEESQVMNYYVCQVWVS